MPEYKRKRVRKGIRPKAKERVNKSDDIVMRSSKSKTLSQNTQGDIKVVRGAKLKRKRNSKIALIAVAAIIAVCLLLSFVLPVGLYENIVNLTATFGSGSYPKDISGSVIFNTISNGSYYYVLSDTNIAAYTNSGKEIYNEHHGFENPILTASETRALIFDQGGNSLNVYNLGGLIDTLETKQPIITAEISRSGNFAVATQSDEYSSVVNVYDKRFKQIYNWNSAKDIINNITINPKGNKIAVSSINANAGQFTSKVAVLTYDSADPAYSLDLGASVVLSLCDTGRGFSVITSDKYRFIKWSKYSTSEITASGEINMLRNSKDGLLLVFNRANDRSDNTVILVSKGGKKLSEFKINSIISDIQYAKRRIYYISDSDVNILDKKGNLLRNGSCEYGCIRFAVIASNSLAVITDQEIQKADIEKER